MSLRFPGLKLRPSPALAEPIYRPIGRIIPFERMYAISQNKKIDKKTTIKWNRRPHFGGSPVGGWDMMQHLKWFKMTSKYLSTVHGASEG